MVNSVYSPVEYLVDALFPFSQPTKLMAMLAAYFDASGTHDESRVLVVAGYVAEVARWKTFNGRLANDVSGILMPDLGGCSRVPRSVQ